ncbi:UV excision repair RAD23 protein [Trypanosoma brucei equiperdum]|uniref:UV excision repair RAD23 protein n=1 Tax=Trypanosoma brucei equiperdum TaxID=630700 RepID=A0A3L6LBM8_9TRYP|nr:UV excision repair RAD23 protein [Trypanosoma brucei equiperdum]
MRIILKSVLGKKREHEVSPDTKVEDIKKFLESEYTPQSLRLCYNNRVLEDPMTMEQLGIGEDTVIVYVGKKQSVQQLASKSGGCASPSTPAEGPAKGELNENPGVAGASSVPVDVPAPSPSAQAPATTQQPSGPAPASLRSVDPALIDSIVAMGFNDREQVSLALRAAYMNADRAVEFLCTGIPPHVQQQLAEADLQASAMGRAAVPSAGTPPSDAGSGGTQSDLRRALSAIPHIDDFRSLLQNNPQAFSALAGQLLENFPQVGELAQQDPEEFARFMMAGSVPDNADQTLVTAGETEVDDAQPLGEEDRAAVNRLVLLGEGAWGEREATEAYRMCGRREDAAAHFLLFNFLGITD